MENMGKYSTYPYVYVHFETNRHIEGINEPILERGMITLTVSIVFLSLYKFYSCPDLSKVNIFVIFNEFRSFLSNLMGLGTSKSSILKKKIDRIYKGNQSSN